MAISAVLVRWVHAAVGLREGQVCGARDVEVHCGDDPRYMSEVDSQQEHWLANLILNSILRVEVLTPYRQQMYNFLRRSHSA